MAAPVIDGFSSSPAAAPNGTINAPTGTKVSITLSGHDADNKTTTVVGHLEDDAGNKSNDFSIPVVWSDKLKLIATTDDGTPISITGLTAIVG